MFIDESGFSLMPNVRRTWGWRGDTPILCHRASHRKKVSAIAALSLSPRRKRVNLFLATYENESIRQDHVVAFLKQLMRRLRGHIVIVWDNIKTHRSRRVRAYAARHRRLHLTHLPPYAPELNPVEWYWCDGKHHRLANHGFTDLPRLHDAVRSHHAAARKDQRRLRSYLRAAALPLRL